jgi:hypothetical protein
LDYQSLLEIPFALLIATARIAGIIKNRSDREESSKNSPSKLEDNALVEFLRFIEKQQVASSNTVYMNSNNITIQGNVENVVKGDQTINNNLTIYQQAVKQIEDAPNIPEEEKSRAKRFLKFCKERALQLMPNAIAIVNTFLGLR